MCILPVTPTGNTSNTVLTPSQIYALARGQGLTPGNAIIATAIALAESGGNTLAQSPPNKNGTIDRGLWQINNGAHPDVLDSCAYNALCNAQAMAAISSQGTNWQAWSTFNNGDYKAHIAVAVNASGTATVPTSGSSGSTSGSNGSSGSTSGSNNPLSDVLNSITNETVLLVAGIVFVGCGLYIVTSPLLAKVGNTAIKVGKIAAL